MGGAIAEGLLRAGFGEVTVSNPSRPKLDRLAALGAVTTQDNAEAAAGADVIVVAVKPWLVEQVLKTLPTEGKTVVSVAAGISGEQLTQWTAPDADLWLAMPNIAAAIGQSMTFLVPVRTTADSTDVQSLFGAIGQTLVTDAKHLAAGTALSGCGIAYALRYVRAATEGGVELGYKAAEAQRIVVQTMLGAVALLEHSGLHPEQLIDQVTTPGGLTIRGLNAMEHAGFTSAVVRGLEASM